MGKGKKIVCFSHHMTFLLVWRGEEVLTIQSLIPPRGIPSWAMAIIVFGSMGLHP